MGLRGPKPKGRVAIKWSHDFAYAIGLLVSDGNLSSDGRHITFTSKDLELAKKFQVALGISGHIGRKASSAKVEKKYFVVQFSDVLFYNFLESIGLMPNKSKIIGEIILPQKFYFDFLRGGAFLLAMPCPFAKLGLHGPDIVQTAGNDKSDPHT